MKIITLNIWSGIVGDALLDFFRENQDVDVFCLQEVMHNGTEWTAWDERQSRNILEQIRSVLPGHADYFRPAEKKDEWGLAMFVKKEIPIEMEAEVFVHLHKESMEEKNALTVGKNLQWIKFEKLNLTVCNFHGLWNGKGKDDTEDRLEQSKKIIEIVKKIDTEIVLCGDFNLLPETQSLKMIEKEFDFRNLVKEFGVTSTRTSYYTKDPKFADYILISQNINVKDFKVLPDEVSDHSPLYLEIE